MNWIGLFLNANRSQPLSISFRTVISIKLWANKSRTYCTDWTLSCCVTPDRLHLARSIWKNLWFWKRAAKTSQGSIPSINSAHRRKSKLLHPNSGLITCQEIFEPLEKSWYQKDYSRDFLHKEDNMLQYRYILSLDCQVILFAIF